MATAVSSGQPELSIERPCLYIVATPIGNLMDASQRMVATLRAVDLILAEDTRSSRPLLDAHAIETPLRAWHDHNEKREAPTMIERMHEQTLALALICDAGTPLISDPGFALVNAAHKHNVPVRAVPGCCAAIAALSIAALPTDRFLVQGFLPAKDAARRRVLARWRGEHGTFVCFEAPHRIVATLAAIENIFGPDQLIAVARELTKQHETLYRGRVVEVRAALGADPYGTRGEFVILIASAGADDDGAGMARKILHELSKYMSRRDAVAVTARITGMARNAIYALSTAHESGLRRQISLADRSFERQDDSDESAG